jgi:hypothetical protein
MNGPSFSQQPSNSREGEAVPKDQKPKKWTNQEKDLGDTFLEALGRFNGAFNEKKDHAAEYLGYKHGYNELPQGVRSYISDVGQRAKQDKANAEFKFRVAKNLATMKEDWDKQYTDPDFRHAKTHPDDEATLG